MLTKDFLTVQQFTALIALKLLQNTENSSFDFTPITTQLTNVANKIDAIPTTNLSELMTQVSAINQKLSEINSRLISVENKLNINIIPNYSNWNPAQLISSLWLDPGDTTTTFSSGSSLSQCSDKSGNNRHATQFVGSAQPQLILNGLNGLSTIRFDGINDVLQLPSTISNVRFVFAICRWNAQGGSWKPLFGNPVIPGGWDCDWQGSENGVDLFSPVYTNPAILNGEKRVNGIVTQRLLSRYTNFTILCFSTTANVNISNLSADRPSSFGDRFSNIEFAELLILPTIPPLAEIEKLEGYGAHKWGLSLSSTHPYKNSPPLV